MPKFKLIYFLGFVLTIVLVGCAHSKLDNQYEQFSKVPERTEWQIVFLKDFPSIYNQRLLNHSVTGVKNDEWGIFYIERISACEGAGGSITATGKVEYIQLQGACTELVSVNGGTREVISFLSLLEGNLLESLTKDGTKWNLSEETLLLKSSENIILGEFLRMQ